MMQGTFGSTSWFKQAFMESESMETWLVPTSEKDVGEEAEEEMSNASSTDQETNFPLVWDRTIELVVGWLPLGLNVPS